MTDWPALHKWSPKYLKMAFKGQHTIAGDYPMTVDNFLAYSQRCRDEMPLYLFDKHFAKKAPQLAADYQAGLRLAHLSCAKSQSVLLVKCPNAQVPPPRPSFNGFAKGRFIISFSSQKELLCRLCLLSLWCAITILADRCRLCYMSHDMLS